MTKTLASILLVMAATPAPAQVNPPVTGGPTLDWASFLGGSGNGFNPSGSDEVSAIRFAPDGNLIVVGFTDSKTFPMVGTFQSPNFTHSYRGGGGDVFIAKIDPTGPAILWSCYLGGTQGQESPVDAAVDSTGAIYIAGTSGSPDFPIVSPPGDGQPLPGDAPGTFLAKLDPTGSQLIWSRSIKFTTVAAMVMSPDSITIVGNESSLPVTNVATDIGQTNWFKTFASAWDVTNTILYNTVAASAAGDATGNLYIGGMTDAKGFTRTAGAMQTAFGGGQWDGFVLKLDRYGSVTWSTLLGGSGDDVIVSLALDSSDKVVVAGGTDSANFPTTAGAYQTVTPGGVPFLTKLNAAGTQLAWSTAIATAAGSPNVTAITLDAVNNVYFVGGASADSTAFPGSERGFQPANMGMSDGLVGRMSADGSQLAWSSYLGGGAGDLAKCITLRNGVLYVGGMTMADDFPVTANGFDKTFGYFSDGILARITDPVADASSAHLTFTAAYGGPSPAGQSVRVIAGATEFAWTGLTDDLEWLDMAPTSGVIDAGTSAEVTVIVNSEGLLPGTYEGSLSLAGPAGASYAIGVTLIVSGTAATTPPVADESNKKSCSAGGAASPLLLIAALAVAAGISRVR